MYVFNTVTLNIQVTGRKRKKTPTKQTNKEIHTRTGRMGVMAKKRLGTEIQI